MRGELIDTTERRRLEERLSSAQKMEAAGKLAGGIAHDFNNILTAILGYSNLLADELPAGRARSRGHRGHPQGGGEGFEPDAAAPRLLEPPALLARKSWTSTRRCRTPSGCCAASCPEDVLLSLSLCRGEAPVLADPAQIEQILLNLAFNARDAMPSGGELRISTAVETIDGPTRGRPRHAPPGTYVVLGVADSGHGHRARHPRQDLRALLHDQAEGARYRARPFHRLRHRPAAGRRGGRRLPSRARAPPSRSGFPSPRATSERRGGQRRIAMARKRDPLRSSSSTTTKRCAPSLLGSSPRAGTGSSSRPTRARRCSSPRATAPRSISWSRTP